jgi:hypothetical protein
MNHLLADLEARTHVAFPEISIERIRTRAPERVDAFDIRQGDRLITVLWTTDDGICVTEIDDESVFDDAPGYVLRSVDEALQVLGFLLGRSELSDVDGVDAPPRKAA